MELQGLQRLRAANLAGPGPKCASIAKLRAAAGYLHKPLTQVIPTVHSQSLAHVVVGLAGTSQ